MTTSRAVILARGLGTRMRAADPSAALTPEQQRAADAGLKAMIPINGRPFLDYILSSLADAGLTRVALVVAPEHDALRRYYGEEAKPARVVVDFVVQREPRGTADAVVAAEDWVRGEPFLTMNADNLYPIEAVRALAALPEPGLPAFDPQDLVRTGNIPAERISSFALLEVDERGYLVGVVEKPDHGAGVASAFRREHLISTREQLVSMNCWRFDARIFPACREVPVSVRGELELPEAVGLAVRRGVPFRTFRARGPVLDLSTRADTSDVARRLAATPVRP
jgi:dTDP-glucose pyrophosphorylase